MYAKWVSNVAEFIRKLKRDLPDCESTIYQPHTKDEIVEWEAKNSVSIPKPYADFLTEGASTCRASYEVFGKKSRKRYFCTMQFVAVDEICLLLESMVDFGNWLANDIDGDVGTVWKNSFPILSLLNGDLLALDLTVDRAPHPVVYLSRHEFSIKTLAKDLMKFLEEWEKINYLGPEIFVIQNFLDPQNGFLSGERNGTNVESLLQEFPI